MQKASVFVKATKKLLTLTKVLAYYSTEFNVPVKKFNDTRPKSLP